MSFKFGVKRFGKWSRSSGRQARHPIDRVRAEREQFEPSEWLKTRGKSWGQIPDVRRTNWPQRLESTRLRCAASLRRASRSSPTRCRSAMSLHPRMNKWGSKDVDTFWTSCKIACCPIWCSLTKRNLTLSSASTIKTTVFGVEMHPWKAGSESTPESNLCYGLGSHHSRWNVSPRFRALMVWLKKVYTKSKEKYSIVKILLYSFAQPVPVRVNVMHATVHTFNF